MQVGAIVTSSRRQADEIDGSVDLQRRDGLADSFEAGLTILGNNLLELTAARLSSAGVRRTTVVHEGLALNKLAGERSSKVTNPSSVWEQAVAQSLQRGIDLLLLIGTTAYIELDYAELVRFHLERHAAMTQVHTNSGSADIALISAARLRETGWNMGTVGALRGECERFNFRGYANRLRNPNDFMQLVEDALYRRCQLRPAAREIANGLWIADSAEVDDSCVIGAPSFVGAHSRVAACCNISGGSAVESACHIDSGTIIERSWVLSNTYIGIGLNVRRSIVSKRKMFHLDRKTEITITDRRLVGSTHSLPLLRTGGRERVVTSFSS